jgi:hypothetical protein
MTHRPTSLVTALAASLLTTTLAAQELLGIAANGDTFAIDTATGEGRFIRASGMAFCNASALKNGDILAFGTNQFGSFIFFVDPVDGAAAPRVQVHTTALRALADGAGANELLGILNFTNDADRLVRINLVNGHITAVGTALSGFSGIQAMTFRGSTLFAWDIDAGLLRIDPATGIATDLFPNVGTSGASIQFLAVDDQNRLLGGFEALFAIDPNTGVASPIGDGSGFANVRGAELRRGTVRTFDQGCPPRGTGTALSASSTGVPGASVTLFSGQHAPGAIGVIYFDDEKTRTPLPGSTCVLGITTEAGLLSAVADGAGAISRTTTLPNVLGAEVLFQLVTFEATAAGPLKMTNGIHVRVPR